MGYSVDIIYGGVNLTHTIPPAGSPDLASIRALEGALGPRNIPLITALRINNEAFDDKKIAALTAFIKKLPTQNEQGIGGLSDVTFTGCNFDVVSADSLQALCIALQVNNNLLACLPELFALGVQKFDAELDDIVGDEDEPMIVTATKGPRQKNTPIASRAAVPGSEADNFDNILDDSTHNTAAAGGFSNSVVSVRETSPHTTPASESDIDSAAGLPAAGGDNFQNEHLFGQRDRTSADSSAFAGPTRSMFRTSSAFDSFVQDPEAHATTDSFDDSDESQQSDGDSSSETSIEVTRRMPQPKPSLHGTPSRQDVLVVKVPISEDSFRVIDNILERSSGDLHSITELEITSLPANFDISRLFVVMPNLRKLTFHNVDCRSLQFSAAGGTNRFPQLQEVEFVEGSTVSDGVVAQFKGLSSHLNVSGGFSTRGHSREMRSSIQGMDAVTSGLSQADLLSWMIHGPSIPLSDDGSSHSKDGAAAPARGYTKTEFSRNVPSGAASTAVDDDNDDIPPVPGSRESVPKISDTARPAHPNIETSRTKREFYPGSVTPHHSRSADNYEPLSHIALEMDNRLPFSNTPDDMNFDNDPLDDRHPTTAEHQAGSGSTIHYRDHMDAGREGHDVGLFSSGAGHQDIKHVETSVHNPSGERDIAAIVNDLRNAAQLLSPSQQRISGINHNDRIAVLLVPVKGKKKVAISASADTVRVHKGWTVESGDRPMNKEDKLNSKAAMTLLSLGIPPCPDEIEISKPHSKLGRAVRAQFKDLKQAQDDAASFHATVRGPHR
ncbi:MAG: hypothetical protein NXI01_04385 [Gammaproteobacteria bacterium]|nr:hypothetical protein [Gammaproteobacteria bacterium]